MIFKPWYYKKFKFGDDLYKFIIFVAIKKTKLELGNTMSTYTLKTDTFRWSEAHIYACPEQSRRGSSRIGVYNAEKVLAVADTVKTYTINNEFEHIRGKRHYELSEAFSRMPLNKKIKNEQLSNHLGNVLVTVSDKKIAKTHGTTAVDYFDPDIVTITDYYAFGAPMPGRHGVENCYIDTIINIDSMYVDMIDEDFSSGIGLFDGTVINDNTSISNVTGDELHIEATWPHNAVGNRYVTLVNGTTYTLTFDLVNSASIGSSTMECAILIPGNIQAQAISSGANSFTFTSSYSGSVAIEFSYITDQSSAYSASVPSFDIDNVILKEFVMKEEFESYSTGSFVANTTVSPSAIANNTTSNSLTIGATWPDNPTAYAPMYLENGVTYNVSYDLNSIYYMAGTDTVECRIHLPSGSIVNQYTSTGTHSFSFMSTTTGWVDIEYAYLTDQDSMYTFWMPSIEIDNVLVTREIINEDFSSSSIGAFVSLPGPASALSASSGTLRISTDEPFRAAAERLIPVTAGHKYSIDFDITHIYNLGVIPHDVRLRVEMAGYPTQHYIYNTIASIPTVYVNVPTGFAGTDIRVEISSIMSSSAHTLGSFIEIDNFKVKHWEGVPIYTYDTICSVNGKRYRYGFNGMEKDNEISGEGNLYTTEFRQYDSRIGRWFALDPLMADYSWQSPYVAFNNNPIFYRDPTGLKGEPPKDQKVVMTADGGYMNLPENTKVTTYSGTTGKGKITGKTINVTQGGVASFTIGNDNYMALYSTLSENEGEFLGYYKNGVYSDNNKYSPEALLYEDKISDGFKSKLLKISFELKQDPNKMLAVFAQETGETFNPGIKSKDGQVGLLQFTQVAIDQINKVFNTSYTKESIVKMTAEEQLDVVKLYFEMIHKPLTTIEDYALATFSPSNIGKSSDTVLYEKGNSRYKKNKGLDTNNDGKITVGEVGAKYAKKYIKL
jgi:RHS repeat-associated protein